MAEAKEIKKTTKKTVKQPETEIVPKVPSVRAAKASKVSRPEGASLQIPLYGLDGKEAKTIELSKAIFDIEASPRLIAQYIRVYRANQRQGNASTKRRSEITGTTKKVYRQKGTGNARHGSEKAPIFVGGGVDSGPKPTDHSLKINKKQKRKVLFSVLTMRAKENAVAALGADILTMTPKTKTIAQFLKNIGADNQKTMIVVAENTDGLKLSVRNLKKVEMISTSNLNAYNILMNDKLLFTEDALTVLNTLYLGNQS